MPDLLSALEADDGLPAFAALIGWPMEPWQAEAMTLSSRYLVLRAPRQTGKSRCIALAAAWLALRRPEQTIIITSASEVGARRLLATVAEVLSAPVLRADVLSEQAGLLTLANGSRLVGLPASERALRGWTADGVCVDEMAFVSDDLVNGAILPLTLARPDAKVIFASSPWTASGAFFDWATLGERGSDPGVRSHRWSVENAPWVSPAEVARLKATMSPARYASEVQGEWSEGSAGFFSRSSLLAATADYLLTPPELADGGAVAFGLDWGRAHDFHAIAAIGICDDGGLNQQAPLIVPFLGVSQMAYLAWARQVVTWTNEWSSNPIMAGQRVFVDDEIAAVGRRPRRGYRVAQVVTEANGVGAAPSEYLLDALGQNLVSVVHTSQASKETGYSRLASWLGEGLLVLPQVERLLSELTALEAVETSHGGISIHASAGSHDDLSMALQQAAHAIRPDALWGKGSWSADERPGALVDVVEAPNGVRVPRRPQTVRTGGIRRRDLLITGNY